MIYKETQFAECRMYVGSVRGYKGQGFTEGHLTRLVQDFQTSWNDKHDWTCAARITRTSYVCMDYAEAGWEIAVINYPRFPRTPEQLTDFMGELREFLMLELRQNRVTIMYDLPTHNTIHRPRHISLAERENAETTHR